MMTLLSLPQSYHREMGTYWNPTQQFCDELARLLHGKRVLEIFAGNGLLAAHLAARGITVTATSEFSSHDCHERGFYHPVEELSAVSAVLKYETASDVLLISWPTTTPAVLQAALRWGSDRDIVFIGEVTDFEDPLALGGCATDAFFEAIEIQQTIQAYTPRNWLDRAMVCRLL